MRLQVVLWLVIVPVLDISAGLFNIMILNDAENTVGNESALAALEYISRNPGLDVQLGAVYSVDSSNCDDQVFFNSVCSQYNSVVQSGAAPHLLIDLTRCPDVSSAARLFMQTVGLPAVSTFPNMLDIREGTGPLQLLHPQDLMLRVVDALAVANQLSSLALLYDNSFGFTIHSEHVVRDSGTRQLVINVEASHLSLRQLMVELRELDVFNYFVLGSLLTAKSIIDSTDCSTYYLHKFAWYILTQEDGQLKFTCRNISVLMLRPDPRPIHRDKFAKLRSTYSLTARADFTSAFYFEVVLKSIMAFRSLVASNSWITTNFTPPLCSKHNDMAYFNGRDLDFLRYFKQLREPVVFAPLQWDADGRGYLDVLLRLELLRVRGREETVEKVAVWRPGLGSSLTFKHTQPRTIYKVVTVLQPPFMLRTVDEAGVEHYSGFCLDLLTDISHIVGFDFQIYVAPDNSFGSLDERGRWGGLIKEIIDKKADIGLTSLSITAERENVVEFTVPYYDLVGMLILMKKHSPKTSHFKFLAAMEGDVWLCVLITYVFASFLLWMFDQFHPQSVLTVSARGLPILSSQTLSLKDCLWICMTSLTPQGGATGPSSLAGFITVGTWWLFGLIIISSYTANLAAFLTVSRLDRQIVTLGDLATQSGIQYAPINGSSGMTYFQRMADIEQRFHDRWTNLTLREVLSEQERSRLAVWEYPLSTKYIHLWKAMRAAGLPNTQEDAVERVLASKSSTEGFAYIGDGTNIRYQCIINCGLQMVGEEFGKLPLGIAVQKNSPIKHSLNKAIVSLLNQRRLEKLKEIWWDEKPKRKLCERHEDVTEEGVYLSNIGGVYMLIVMGLLLAGFTLVFEYYDAGQQSSAPLQPIKSPFHNWGNERSDQRGQARW